MTNETLLNGQGVDLNSSKDVNTRTWANALKKAASFAKEQAFTFGGKLITPPHERLEFKIKADHTLSTIYAEKSQAYTTLSSEIEESKLEIKKLEEKIKSLTAELESENVDQQNTEETKSSLLDANNKLKTAKSSLNKSKISLWFVAFTYAIVKTPKYAYNLGSNVVNLFLRALGVVINACAFALYAVSYLVLQLRILVASVMKYETKDMSTVWDTANEQTSYAAVVYAYLTYPAPKLDGGKSGNEVDSSNIVGAIPTNGTSSKNAKKNLTNNLEQSDEGKDISSNFGYSSS